MSAASDAPSPPARSFRIRPVSNHPAGSSSRVSSQSFRESLRIELSPADSPNLPGFSPESRRASVSPGVHLSVNSAAAGSSSVSSSHSAAAGISPVSSSHAVTFGISPVSSGHAVTFGISPVSSNHSAASGISPVSSSHAVTFGISPVSSSHAAVSGISPVSSGRTLCSCPCSSGAKFLPSSFFISYKYTVCTWIFIAR